MDKKPTAKEAYNRLEEQQNALIRLMKSPDGEIALKFLKVKYSGNVMVKGDPHATYARIGERVVVDYLTELREGNDV